MIGFRRAILTAHEERRYFSGERRRPVRRHVRRPCPHASAQNPRDSATIPVDSTSHRPERHPARRLENDRLDLFVGKRPHGEDRGTLSSVSGLVWVATPHPHRPRRPCRWSSTDPEPEPHGMQAALDRTKPHTAAPCVCRRQRLIAAVAAARHSAMAKSLVPVQLSHSAASTAYLSWATSTSCCSPTPAPSTAGHPGAGRRRAGQRALHDRADLRDRYLEANGMAIGRIGEPVAPRSFMQAPTKANSSIALVGQRLAVHHLHDRTPHSASR